MLIPLLALLVGLGNWQVERRAWKLALISQVEKYATAEPAPVPSADQWKDVGASDVYRRFILQGRFQHQHASCVQAVTIHGRGFWIMTPLQLSDGNSVFVNRGFVAEDQCDAAIGLARDREAVEIVGRLRLSEPTRGFLRENDPQNKRWYSRNVEQLARAHDLTLKTVAPFFIDAEKSTEGGPIGGLTVIQFRNHHLGYALTWFGLALLVALAVGLIARQEWQRARSRRRIR